MNKDVRERPILSEWAFRSLLNQYGPCEVTKVAGSGDEPPYIQIRDKNDLVTCHYLMEDIIETSFKSLIDKLPKPMVIGAPDLSKARGVISAIVGKNVDLTPEYEEDLELTITKDGAPVESPTLKFDAITEEAAGKYEVVAKNKYGEAKSSFELRVYGATTLSNVDGMSATKDGNKLTYSGEIKYFTEADGLELSNGQYVTGNAIGIMMAPTPETAAALQLGKVLFGSKLWSTADAFAVSYPGEEPNFEYWPCVTKPGQTFSVIIDWLGTGNPLMTEVFEVVIAEDATIQPNPNAVAASEESPAETIKEDEEE